MTESGQVWADRPSFTRLMPMWNARPSGAAPAESTPDGFLDRHDFHDRPTHEVAVVPSLHVVEAPKSGQDRVVDRLDLRLDRPVLRPGRHDLRPVRDASHPSRLDRRRTRGGDGRARPGPVEHQQRLAPGQRPAGDGAVGAVSAGLAVEHQDVLPVVLRADLVHVEDRHRRVRHRLAHHAVALVVLLPSPRRRGAVVGGRLSRGERGRRQHHRAAVHGAWPRSVGAGGVPDARVLGVGARPGRHVPLGAADDDDRDRARLPSRPTD